MVELFLSRATFYPRLIAHEFAHAWKGVYLITSDENWGYNDVLSGFEEATAEGMAFEIVHEYVRSYPNDYATLYLLGGRPHQYWSAETIHYDMIKNQRYTGAGSFLVDASTHMSRYSIAATTMQIISKEDSKFYPKMMQKYYDKINSDPTWRPNRNDILSLWAQIVPQINNTETKKYLNSLPVFQGRQLDKGLYILSVIRPYGTSGDQQLAAGYSLEEGSLYYGLKSKKSIYNLPGWIKYDDGYDAYIYLDTQNQPITIDVFNMNDEKISTVTSKTKYERHDDGTASGFGWVMVNDLAMENFPIGLYKETIVFDNYIAHTENAKEDIYFFGYKGSPQKVNDEYEIMIGVDGVADGSVTVKIDDVDYMEPILNGAAMFRSTDWAFDMEGKFSITITDDNSNSNTYYRTILEAGTFHGYFQHQFIIIDKDFNGVEDIYE